MTEFRHITIIEDVIHLTTLFKLLLSFKTRRFEHVLYVFFIFIQRLFRMTTDGWRELINKQLLFRYLTHNIAEHMFAVLLCPFFQFFLCILHIKKQGTFSHIQPATIHHHDLSKDDEAAHTFQRLMLQTPAKSSCSVIIIA